MSKPADITSAPMSPRVAAEFVLLGLVWGGSFLLMRIAAPEIGPVTLAFFRVAAGALVLAPFLWRARARIAPFAWQLAGIGVLNSALPFVLFAWATARAPAGVSAIANATTVMLTALVAFVMFGERIGLRRSIGLLAGLVGVVVLAAGNAAGMNVASAAIAGVLASLCYAVSANLVRVHLAGLPPIAVAAATLLGASAFLALPAWWSWPGDPVTGRAWAAAAVLGLVCTGAAYALFFRIIGTVGPSRAVTVTYLVPLFGVAWAWWILGEPLTLAMAVAGLLILGGVAMSQGRERKAAPVPAVVEQGAVAALDADSPAGSAARPRDAGRRGPPTG